MIGKMIDEVEELNEQVKVMYSVFSKVANQIQSLEQHILDMRDETPAVLTLWFVQAQMPLDPQQTEEVSSRVALELQQAGEVPPMVALESQ